MKCEECQEQVFELIEREALDPEGVHEVLARCPDCRERFDAMKAALKSVEALPVEEPRAAVDAAVMQAAAARVAPPRRRRFHAPQWAAAAVALLAVGLGVWAIPTDAPEPRVDEALAFEMAREPEAQLAEASGPSEREDVLAEAEPLAAEELAGNAGSAVATAEPLVPMAKSAPAASRKSEAKRRLRAPASERVAAEEAFADEQAGDSGVALALDSRGSAEVAPAAPTARSAPAKKASLSAECQARISKLGAEKDAQSSVGAEEALALGRCYADAGDDESARRWFELAAKDSKTRRRATRALRELGDD